MKHGKEYICRRWRMLTWLMDKGYKLVRTIPDAKRQDFVNWVFENSEELEKDVETYFNEVVSR